MSDIAKATDYAFYFGANSALTNAIIQIKAGRTPEELVTIFQSIIEDNRE